MKRLLISVLLAAPAFAIGQEAQSSPKRWDILLQGGISIVPEAGIHYHNNGNSATYKLDGAIAGSNGFLTLKRISLSGKWAYGLRIGLLSLKVNEGFFTDNNGNPIKGISSYLAKPAVSASIIASRKLNSGKLQLWANGYAGYQYNRVDFGSTLPGISNAYNSNGVVAGLQLQANYPIYHSLYASLTSGFDFNYTSGNIAGFPSTAYSVYSFPILLGIGTRF